MTLPELPIELYWRIFELSAARSRRLALVLSLVSKDVRRLVLPHAFKTVIVTRNDGDLVDHHHIPYPSLVRHLWVEPPSRKRRIRSAMLCEDGSPCCAIMNHNTFLTDLTHLAVPDPEFIKFLDCDDLSLKTHELSKCQSLTFFAQSTHFVELNLGPKARQFLFNNITHLQIFPLGSPHPGGTIDLESLVRDCVGLTHLAMPAPDLSNLIHMYEMSRYKERVFRAMTRNKRSRLETLVLLVDWYKWSDDCPNGDGMGSTFLVLSVCAMERFDDRHAVISPVNWPPRREHPSSFDSTPWNGLNVVRDHWLRELSGEKTVWEQARENLEMARSYQKRIHEGRSARA